MDSVDESEEYYGSGHSYSSEEGIDSDHEEEDTHIKSRILTLLETLTDLINELPE